MISDSIKSIDPNKISLYKSLKQGTRGLHTGQ